MWSEPYLETCCRSALHRLVMAGAAGRPAGSSRGQPGEPKDGPCLARLAADGLARQRQDHRFEPTAAGHARYAREVLRRAG